MATVNRAGPTATGLAHLALALAMHREVGWPAQLQLAQLRNVRVNTNLLEFLMIFVIPNSCAIAH